MLMEGEESGKEGRRRLNKREEWAVEPATAWWLPSKVQGDHLQLSFFEHFETGKKFIKNPKPSEKTTR